MSTKLVIVESPNKVRSIAGYLGPEFDVEASVGHIRDLPQPSELPATMKKGPYGKFAVDVEDDFTPYYVVNPDKKKTVAQLKKALKEADELYLATDDDREGEAIFRRIADMEGSRKPELRLWVASLEAEAIQAAWRAMQPESEYRGLAWSAEIRSKADWLIGMNASRAYSLLYNARFSVGRVQTPTLAMIAERDRQIRNHKPVPFWTVIADMGGWRLSSERIDNREVAMLLCGQVEHGRFRIISVNRRKVNDRPPRLYDLTGLQKDMSRLHGMTAARTLQALQHLYELKTRHLSAHRQPVHHARRPRNAHGAPRIRQTRPGFRHTRGHTRTPAPGAGRQRREGGRPHRDPADHATGRREAGRPDRRRTQGDDTHRAPHVGSRGRRPCAHRHRSEGTAFRRHR